jgi:endonuclease/exonuclease/phosphatase family metal-dependent hydrolase
MDDKPAGRWESTEEEIFQEIKYRTIVDELRRFPTLRALYESETYRLNQQALFWILGVPQPYILDNVQPRVRDFIRVVQWNIEKGKSFGGLVENFSMHPVLRYADVIFLNEVDYGMARSGNRHVARELGAWLRMHVAFAPAHLELTKGTGDDAGAPGENQTSLQGNALLSRHPLGQLRIIDLPSYFEPFEFEEKRFGRRIALVAEIIINGKILTTVCTHLEVRTTPRGRARQMTVLLEKLDRLGLSGPALLAGDLNTAAFSRGTPWRAIRSTAKLLCSRPLRLKESLLHPDRRRREPMFAVLKRHGFSIEEFNSREATHGASLATLEENDQLPPALRKWAHQRLDQYDHQLELKLDWIAGRSVRALTANQVIDSKSGIAGINPQAIKSLSYDGRKISDHDPIVADIQLV